MPTIKPEFFNYDMTRAILDGRKTATRRIVKAGGHKVEKLLSVSYTHLTLPTNSRV